MREVEGNALLTTIQVWARSKLWAEQQENPHMTDGAGSQVGNTLLAFRP